MNGKVRKIVHDKGKTNPYTYNVCKHEELLIVYKETFLERDK